MATIVLESLGLSRQFKRRFLMSDCGAFVRWCEAFRVDDIIKHYYVSTALMCVVCHLCKIKS